jgi:hypothetical protein
VVQQLHSRLRTLFLAQRSNTLNAMKLGKAITMFAAFHFILAALAVLFGDLLSIAGLCAAVGYIGARLYHPWLLCVYLAWLIIDTVLELYMVSVDDGASVQSRVLLIIFQLLVYGAAFVLVVRLLRILRFLRQSRGEADSLLAQQQEYLRAQLNALRTAGQTREAPTGVSDAWQAQLASVLPLTALAPFAPPPATAPSCTVQPLYDASRRLHKEELQGGWPEHPPKTIGDALALCLQVQRQLVAVWGPRATSLRSLRTSTALSSVAVVHTAVPSLTSPREEPPARSPRHVWGESGSRVSPQTSSSTNFHTGSHANSQDGRQEGSTFWRIVNPSSLSEQPV